MLKRQVILLLCLASPTFAQNATVSTIVRSSPGGLDGTGSAARFSTPTVLAFEPGGNLLAGDNSSLVIRRITPAAVVTTVIGSDRGVLFPRGLAADSSGNIYFTHFVGGAVLRLTPAGVLENYTTTPSVGALGAQLAIGPAGDLFVYDFGGLWRVDASRQAVRYAGGGPAPAPGSPDVDGPLGVGTIFPAGLNAMCVDAAGNLYFTGNQVIRKVTPDGTITTIAGAHATAGSSDGVGTAARFNGPLGLATDAAGNLYIADTLNHTIRKMTADGTVTTIAGVAGTLGYADGAAASALFSQPRGLAVDGSGSVFVADANNSVIRKIAGGTVTTFAGLAATITAGTVLDIAQPRGIAIDVNTNILLADAATHTVRLFLQSSRTSRTYGKRGVAGSADGAAIATARYSFPEDLVIDSAANIYVGQTNAIRRIAPDGTVTTFAGKLNTSGTADGTGSAARFGTINALAIDSAGNLYAGEVCAIRKITPAAVVTTIAGQPGTCGHTDGTGSAARFGFVRDLAIGADGTLYATGNNVLRAVTSAGVVTTLAGTAGVAGTLDGTGSAARFSAMNGVVVDATGTIYVGDQYAVRKVTSGGVVTTLAGLPGTQSLTPVDGTGAAARFRFVAGLVVATDGTLYAMDTTSIRAITPSGVVTTVAGPSLGTADGVGAAAAFSNAEQAFIDSSGTIFFLDGNAPYTVRTFVPSSKVVTTLFGLDTTQSTSNDGFAFAVARFNAPSGIALAADGSAYVADTGNHTIRRIASDAVTTFAGLAGSSGSADGTGGAARFSAPQGIAVDTGGNVYVADTGNNAIRRITSGGVVTTVSTQFASPRGVAVDAAGNIYVADTANHVIKVIAPGGSISTLAGAAGISGSADGTGSAARFSSPSALTVVAGGTIHVADTGNHTLRAVISAGAVTTIAGLAGATGIVDGVGAASRFSGPEALTADAGGALYVGDTANGAIRLAIIGTPTMPTITANPISRSVSLHETVQFSCAATGMPTPTYRWERMSGSGATGSPLSDSATLFGTNTTTLTLTDPRTSDNGNRYRCRATNAAGSAVSNIATLTVFTLTLTPGQGLAFGMYGPVGLPPTTSSPPQTVEVGWLGTGAPAWTVSADATLLQITNGSGAGAGRFTVTPIGYGTTNYLAETGALTTLTLTSADDPDLTKTLPVSIARINTNRAPVGVFDTPANNATGLQGSLAVTGWALDEIELERVEIWRDPVGGETTPVFSGSGPGSGKIFIANATIVPGARPDVETLYAASRPNARNAGWGYMLLTQGLWNQGNGTYTLYAFAFDKLGGVTTLGTKTITVDNANATKPFGAIDTPGQGETVSGIVNNFGWALTPGSTCAVPNNMVQVSIDSGPLTPVAYGDPRSDIATGFPGYTNAAAAGGHTTLDTTALTNGLHTIGWFVTDTCGRADGVGSRFFTVANSSLVALPSPVGPTFRSGAFGAGTAPTRVIRVGQNERIEVPLPVDGPYRAGPLPLGSSFDSATNTFMWQPAAGFLGAYDLQFFPPEGGSHMSSVGGSHNSPVSLRVVVGPPIRMVIDTPRAGNVLASSGFTVAGWAVDLGSIDGAGIDTLHVWAYPVGPSTGSGQVAPPVFVGVAQPRGPRPDVGRLYGASFGDAGFTLSGTLAPGTYDLVVFAHSAARNAFDGAQSVRVIVR